MAAEARAARFPTRVLVGALALLLLVFFTQVASHVHENGQEDATCQVCQGAHVAPAVISSVLAASTLVALEYIQPATATFHQELFFADCPSRAPPAIFA